MAPQSKPTIAYAAIRELRLIILIQGRRDPTDGEWAEYVRQTSAVLTQADARVLVLTEGGHPTREQQGLMNSSMPRHGIRVAVISPSVVARFVTSVLVFANPDIRCFSPEQREQAYRHLGLLTIEVAQVEKQVKQLKESLGIASTC